MNSWWQIDLTTRAGAQSAVRMGSIAAFIFAGMGVLGALLVGLAAGAGTAEGLGVIIGGALEAVLGLIAGLRMRAGKGLVWAVVVAVFLVLELIGKLVMFSIVGSVLTAVVLVYLVNGIRGLRALKTELGYDDADVATFE
jgi:hypothetical protein